MYIPIMSFALSWFSQAAAQSSYQALTDQKEKSAQQHHVELTALSSNLSGLRQQVESYKKRINTAEATVKEQTAQIAGTGERERERERERCGDRVRREIVSDLAHVSML